MANVAASVLAKLKNKARIEGIAFQQILNLFCQEEFIRRLSKSQYKENLVLKGGFLLYAISGFKARPTIDADYLLQNSPNNLDEVEQLVKAVLSTSSDNDYIRFELQKLATISEIKEYHGIRVNLIGYIDRTRTPFSIDFGVGDIIVPNEIERTLPVILEGFEAPKILTYSLEAIVAEKIDAIISLMEATGRMKDFYDIYYLAVTYDFDGRKLQDSISKTLINRKTPYEKDSVIAVRRLLDDEDIQQRWQNFCMKILKVSQDFEEVVQVIIDFFELAFYCICRR